MFLSLASNSELGINWLLGFWLEVKEIMFLTLNLHHIDDKCVEKDVMISQIIFNLLTIPSESLLVWKIVDTFCL